MISDSTLRRVLRSDYVVRWLGDIIRSLIALAVIAACGVLILYNAVFFATMKNTLHFNDFGKFYDSAVAYLDHEDMYGPTPATAIEVSQSEVQQFWNLNPPHFELLMRRSWTFLGQPHGWASATVGSVYVWAAVLIFFGIVFDGTAGSAQIPCSVLSLVENQGAAARNLVCPRQHVE